METRWKLDFIEIFTSDRFERIQNNCTKVKTLKNLCPAMTEVDPTMGDAININIINININIDININFCPAMAEVDPTMGDAKESTSRLEDIKYYTRCYFIIIKYYTRCCLIKILHKVLFHDNKLLYWSIIIINIIAISTNLSLVISTTH